MVCKGLSFMISSQSFKLIWFSICDVACLPTIEQWKLGWREAIILLSHAHFSLFSPFEPSKLYSFKVTHVVKSKVKWNANKKKKKKSELNWDGKKKIFLKREVKWRKKVKVKKVQKWWKVILDQVVRFLDPLTQYV